MKSNTILLVEDNARDEALTLRALRKCVRVDEIVVARDGVEALDYLFGTGKYAGRDIAVTPKLIMLDLKLPKVDGLQVLRELRADPRTHNLPVVVFTSSSEQEDIIESYDLGANSYVRKPVDFEQFAETAQSLGMYWVRHNEPAPTD